MKTFVPLIAGILVMATIIAGTVTAQELTETPAGHYDKWSELYDQIQGFQGTETELLDALEVSCDGMVSDLYVNPEFRIWEPYTRCLRGSYTWVYTGTGPFWGYERQYVCTEWYIRSFTACVDWQAVDGRIVCLEYETSPDWKKATCRGIDPNYPTYPSSIWYVYYKPDFSEIGDYPGLEHTKFLLSAFPDLV